MPDITVLTPTIPGRGKLLARAVASVHRQHEQPMEHLIGLDHAGVGAVTMRNDLLAKVVTPWVAFLDDDDEFLPEHLRVLRANAARFHADYVFSDFRVPEQPHFDLASFCWGDWDGMHPLQTTITVLVRTELAQQVGFTEPPPGATIGPDRAGEDLGFTIGCAEAGARIHHVRRVTWLWHHHGGNLSGRSWKAVEGVR